MAKSNNRDLLVGFDLGGTKMMAAVLDEKFKILARNKKRTRAEKGPESCFTRIVEVIRGALKAADADTSRLRGIGMGVPGPLDPYEGVIIDTPNIGFKNFALRSQLEKVFDVPAAIDNDVNMGIYGEYHFGAAKGYKQVVGIFPGTGIGGGLILDGKLFRGATGGAGEIGHMIIQVEGPLCGCGRYGCLEALASRSAITKEAVALAARGDAPTILKEAGTDLTAIKSSVLAKAFKAGDTEIRKIILRSAWFLGVGMANLVNLLSPEAIVLGGGLIEAMPDDYMKEASLSMRSHAFPFLVKDVQVLKAKLGDDAVVMGAAKLIRDALDGKSKK